MHVEGQNGFGKNTKQFFISTWHKRCASVRFVNPRNQRFLRLSIDDK